MTEPRTWYTILVRPILFRLDPKTAHNLCMAAMIGLSLAIGGAVRIRRGVRRPLGR